MSYCFFFNDTATTEIYTLSLHDALPISLHDAAQVVMLGLGQEGIEKAVAVRARPERADQTDEAFVGLDRKSTRLNSSHSQISYAVFCLKKKKKHYIRPGITSTLHHAYAL